MNSFSLDEKILNLEIATIPFRIRNMTGFFRNEINQLEEAYFTKGLFVCSLILTIDEKFVFGKLSGKTFNNTKFDLIGGTLCKDENEINSGKDIFNSLYSEFVEEVNLLEENIEDCTMIGAILNENFQVGLIFFTKINLTSNELNDEFLEKNDGEMKALEFVSSDAIATFLTSFQGWKSSVSILIA